MRRALRPHRAALLLSPVACGALVLLLVSISPAARGGASVAPTTTQDAARPQKHAWHIVARKYSYSVPRLEVEQDDLVEITLETADIPHSFTIDEPYRIAKRVTPDRPVVFEFRADKAGTFEFYCNLKADDGCRAMKGQLVVKPKR
jgi:heme/copper-type cytochrome/quinol oxidase subunit 2